jgi:hypothetical protein
MLAEKMTNYDRLVRKGQIAEDPSLANAGKDELDFGKDAAAYAECAFSPEGNRANTPADCANSS